MPNNNYDDSYVMTDKCRGYTLIKGGCNIAQIPGKKRSQSTTFGHSTDLVLEKVK